MHWDRLFEDLEGQLASEWEAERAALDAESERLRISRLELRSRIRMLCAVEARMTLDLAGGQRLPVRLRALGADWLATEPSSGGETAAPLSISIVPLHAISGMSMDHGMLLTSLDPQVAAEPALRERMTFGFLLRDFARRRVPVRIALRDGDEVHGTIDRAGADHLDLAVHDAGDVRRADAVRGFRIVPFSALLWLRASGEAQLP
ncbi:hypothetical protein [Microbacterium sp. LWH12-1.2]|uniref:hypothetical protein n=1 Tax=Microbacterium sp. LWH12-1.2 TaxID=3135259 RepID=UPI003443793C